MDKFRIGSNKQITYSPIISKKKLIDLRTMSTSTVATEAVENWLIIIIVSFTGGGGSLLNLGKAKQRKEKHKSCELQCKAKNILEEKKWAFVFCMIQFFRKWNSSIYVG